MVEYLEEVEPLGKWFPSEFVPGDHRISPRVDSPCQLGRGGSKCPRRQPALEWEEGEGEEGEAKDLIPLIRPSPDAYLNLQGCGLRRGPLPPFASPSSPLLTPLPAVRGSAPRPPGPFFHRPRCQEVVGSLPFSPPLSLLDFLISFLFCSQFVFQDWDQGPVDRWLVDRWRMWGLTRRGRVWRVVLATRIGIFGRRWGTGGRLRWESISSAIDRWIWRILLRWGLIWITR